MAASVWGATSGIREVEGMKIISSSKIKIILKKTLKTVSPRETLRDAHLLIREEFVLFQTSI